LSGAALAAAAATARQQSSNCVRKLQTARGMSHGIGLNEMKAAAYDKLRKALI
jgi:hypothetical protein